MTVFQEEQRFPMMWSIIVLLLTLPLMIYVFFFSDEKENLSRFEYYFAVIAYLLVIFLIHSIKMTTTVTKEDIRVRFTPFHIKPKVFAWSEIENAFVRDYKPVREYGGWGVRYSFKNGRAYNIAGNKGLQLELNNGKKVLIGTQKEMELDAVVKELSRRG